MTSNPLQRKTLNKKIGQKNFEIEYEFIPSQDYEKRLLQAYEMVFEEIDKIVIEEKEYEQK